MTTVVVEASDPRRLARFWAQALEWEPTAGGSIAEGSIADGTSVRPRGAGDVGLLFVRSLRPKTAKNRVHLDLAGDADEVRRLLALGATRLDIGQGAVPWEVLADPEGNEFCVLPRAGSHGRLAQICQDAADPGSQGRFWAEASGWSIVDEGDWGISLTSAAGDGPTLVMGPPVAPKEGPNRLQSALMASAGSDPSAEAKRLLTAGASPVDMNRADIERTDIATGESRRQLLADPEGNEFLILGRSQAEPSGA
ncbi:VOC family protein [Streptomyces nigrescens]|uniref:VOC family protein n=1 Tax=Streptomyces nigrescens TaxID=1920 RepID=UPI0021C3BFCD|nr:VOC family protein [Streptomyces nigrescens]